MSNGYERTYCAGGALVSALYCHVEVLGSIPGQGEIYTKKSRLRAHAAHSAVLSRSGLYLVECKAVRERLANEKPRNAGLKKEGR